MAEADDTVDTHTTMKASLIDTPLFFSGKFASPSGSTKVCSHHAKLLKLL